MKYVFKHFSVIRKDIQRAGGAILLLDFDGVLSAIALSPDEAFITKKNKKLLKACAKHFPTAVITGRTLDDIKEKVGLKDIFFIASHGLEWKENDKHHIKEIPKETIDAIQKAKEKIKSLESRYPGMIFEDKSFMFAAHYRKMNSKSAAIFIKEMNQILKPIVKNSKLRLDHNLKTFELRPEIDWDKGDSALFAIDYFRNKTIKKLMPIYIGDGLTDEDAFRALKKGIAIRVGKNKKSVAKWYLKSQKEVGVFLKWLLNNN